MRRWTPVCVLLAALCAGCSTFPVRELAPSESSICQELLSESTRKEIAELKLSDFRGRKVHVQVTHVAGAGAILNASYVRQLLANELLRNGAIIVEEPSQADTLITGVMDVGGLELASSTFPPGWLYGILPLVSRRTVTARVSVGILSHNTDRLGVSATQTPPPVETASWQLYVFGIGPFSGSE